MYDIPNINDVKLTHAYELACAGRDRGNSSADTLQILIDGPPFTRPFSLHSALDAVMVAYHEEGLWFEVRKSKKEYSLKEAADRH